MQVDTTGLTTIIFDVDGTLYRQPPLRRAMLLRLSRMAMLDPLSAWTTFRALRAYRHAQELLRDAPIDGALATAQMQLACSRSRLGEDVVAPVVARWMEREPLPLLARCVDPALRPFLDEARSRRIRLGVLSDYPAADKLEAMGLGGLFDVLVPAQDPEVNRFKPDPKGLVEALRRLDAVASRTLYVGDRPEVDARVARAAGVPCIILGRREPPAHSREFACVRNYTELRALLFSSQSESTS